MLKTDPTERLSMQEALRHEWLVDAPTHTSQPVGRARTFQDRCANLDAHKPKNSRRKKSFNTPLRRSARLKAAATARASSAPRASRVPHHSRRNA